MTTPARPTRRRDQRELDAAAFRDVIAALSGQVGRLTELVELTRGAALNHVLHTETIALPSTGVSRDFPVPFAAITLANGGSGIATVVGAPLGSWEGLAPPNGVGMFTVGSHACRTAPLAGTAVSIYGAPGASVDLTVWARPQPPNEGYHPAGPAAITAIPLGGGFVALPSGTAYCGYSLTAGSAGATVTITTNSGGEVVDLDLVTIAANETASAFYPGGMGLPGLIVVTVNAGSLTTASLRSQ